MKHKYANGKGTPFAITIYKSRYLSSFRKLGVVTLLICLFSFHFVCFAQESRESGATGIGEVKPLRVGDKVPEEFWTKEHLFYVNGDTTTITLEKYKGTPFILDFWASWCGVCFYCFPKDKELQAILSDSVRFVLVNSDFKYDNNLRTISNALNKNEIKEIEMSSIIFDNYLKELFPHTAIPHYVWIDYTQRIRAITTFDHVTLDQLRRFANIANIGKRGGK